MSLCLPLDVVLVHLVVRNLLFISELVPELASLAHGVLVWDTFISLELGDRLLGEVDVGGAGTGGLQSLIFLFLLLDSTLLAFLGTLA